jgi:hypothetical protein
MQRTWLTLIPIILLAGCSRSNPPVAAQPVPKSNPEPVAQATQPLGYAPASSQVPAARPADAQPAVADAADAAPAPSDESAPVEAAAEANNRGPAGFTIPRGTTLHVRLDETVDTRHNRPGDAVHATLYQPVVVDGRTVIPSGTRFTGHVTVADPSGRLKGRGHVGVALDAFHIGGRRYAINTTSVERASGSHKKRNGILIGGATGLGAALGAIAGGPKGALIGAGAGAAVGTGGAAATGKLHVSIPAEAPLTFTLRTPVGV